MRKNIFARNVGQSLRKAWTAHSVYYLGNYTTKSCSATIPGGGPESRPQSAGFKSPKFELAFGANANRRPSRIPASTLVYCENTLRRHFSSASESKAGVGGIVQVELAQTGEGIADCELLRWFVHEGEEVEEFQPLCEVQSDKASVEITSRYKGRVTHVNFIPGDIVKVGEVLLELVVTQGGEGISVDPPDVNVSEEPSSDLPNKATSAQVGKSIQATPAVRHLAKNNGINLADVRGSGDDGRILKKDVLSFVMANKEVNEEVQAMQPPADSHIGMTSRDTSESTSEGTSEGTSESTSEGTSESTSEGTSSESDSSDSENELEKETPQKRKVLSKEDPIGEISVSVKPVVDDLLGKDKAIPIRGFRRTMAKTMTAAVAVPHFHYTEHINVDALVKLRDSLKSVPLKQGVKLTFLPFLLKTLSLSLQKFPAMNSIVNQDVSEITVRASHNIGVGMATSSGLVVPNIKNVQNLSVLEIAEELSRLTQLAATNKLANEDITGGTITVSNFGSIGGLYGSPILNLPEVAIVAVGRIQKLPRFAEDGSVYPAHIMGVTWGADHRVVDGATVASFCNQWKLLIEQPGRFLLNMR